jgi:orotate phosphoribosyltransferase
MDTFRARFLAFAIEREVIRFGQFTTKAGRPSPYFFNAGLFNDGASMHALCAFYADAVIASGIEFDVIFGPAYKGIALAAGLAMALAQRGRNAPFCYNRKEAKDHGEGGTLVGAPLKGRVLVIDDVISAGTSIRESVALMRAAGATPHAVVTALDRMERGTGSLSAVQEVRRDHDMQVFSIATLDDLVAYLEAEPDLIHHVAPILAYRAKYGVTAEAG